MTTIETASARFSTPVLLMSGILALGIAGTVALWAYYGTAVFFEMIRAGFAACF